MIDRPIRLRFHQVANALSPILATLILTWLFANRDGSVRVFGRWDVIGCGCLASLPLVTIVAVRISSWSRFHRLMFAVGCTALALLISVIGAFIVVAPGLSMIPIAFCRGTIAINAVMATRIVLDLIGFKHSTRGDSGLLFGATPADATTTTAVMVGLAFLIPMAYADGVADGLTKDLQQSLDSRRYALATRQAFQISQLLPGQKVNRKPVQTVHQELNAVVIRLTAEVARAIPSQTSSADSGTRITLLMHLDRNLEALSLLEPLTNDSQFRPIALDYQGLCHQRLQQYSQSLASYKAALADWQSHQPNHKTRSGLASAWKGIGYAARRLDQRTLEENAYRDLVRIMPSAENHLLLAQCYREHQKTRLAATHSSIAMRLDPELSRESESMLASMSTDHFGCMQVPRR